MSETNKIPTTEKDFLEQDQVIRGQNYVCLSFISPDEVIEKKEQYFFGKFMENYCKQNTELLGEYEQIFPEKKDIIRHIREKYNQLFDHSSIKEAYDNFVKSNADELQTEYNDTHSFQTNIRGIKVRGVYDTVQEAEHRCETLKKIDNNKFNIYVAQVGCWCPWSPNPDDVKDPVYAETELNTLMHEYNKNLMMKDEFYQDRKNELHKRIIENEIEKKKHVDQDDEGDDDHESDNDYNDAM